MNPVIIVLGLILLSLIGPMFTIVAINTLFGTAIPIDVGTWFAMFWLGIAVKAATR